MIEQENIIYFNNLLKTIKKNNQLFNFTQNFITKYNDLPFLSNHIEKVLIEKEKIMLNNEIKLNSLNQVATEKRKHKI